MQLAREAAELASDVVRHEPAALEALNLKIRELLDLAVGTNGDHRETTFRLACALSDFADIWGDPKNQPAEGGGS